MKAKLSLLSLFLLAAFLTGCGLAGCSSNETSSGTAGAPMRADSGSAPAQSKVEAESKGEVAATPNLPIAGQDRKLARTARLVLTATDVRFAVEQARQIAVTAGGYSGSERTELMSATLSVTVPSDKLDAALAQLSELGHVTTREQNTQDVTEQVVDVESRLASQRASVERVRALLDRATSISEITSIERELTTREADLESLEARQASLSGSVAMSTVSLTISAAAAPAATPTPDDTGFLAGLASGWRGFLAFGGGFLHVVGAVAPFLFLLGTPAAALLWWLRHRRHRLTPTPTE